MAFDWAVIIPKGAIASVVSWLVIKYRKPVWDWGKKMVAMPKEIDELKAENEKLKSDIVIANNVQHAVLRVYKNPIFRLNENMEFTGVNPAFFEMTGFSDLQSVLGMQFMVAIPKGDRAMIKEIVEDMKNHPASYVKHIRIEHAVTGKVVEAICRMDPIRDGDENVIEFMGQIFDKSKL